MPLVKPTVVLLGAGSAGSTRQLLADLFRSDAGYERLRWAAVASAPSTRGAGGTASQATRADLVPR